MAEEPERLRHDIETTRASLTRDVDLLADRASPARAAQRRWNAAKEKVMGSANQARQVAADSTPSAMSTVHDAPQATIAQAREAVETTKNQAG